MTVARLSLITQAQTVGLMGYQQDTQEGYVLFSPFMSTSTYLIDSCGQLINGWESAYTSAAATVLMENGNLLKTSSMGVAANPVFTFGGGGEKIQEIDWDGTIVWEFTYSMTRIECITISLVCQMVIYSSRPGSKKQKVRPLNYHSSSRK